MSFASLFVKLALPVSTVAFANLATVTAPATLLNVKSLAPDSTLTVPIAVLNKNRLPTVTIEKEVAIPQGYAYVEHSLSLVSAFPIEGAEQSADWITGPNHTWSIYTKLEMNCKQPEHILIRATAAPGRKNEEIGAQAVLLVGIRRLGKTN
jgi:hypothetical protein